MTEKTPKNECPAPFCLRFTDDARKTLELAAGDRPLSAYIRWLIFGDEIPKSRTRDKKPVKDKKELTKLLALFGQSRIASIKNDGIEYMTDDNDDYKIGYDNLREYLPTKILDLLDAKFSTKILFISE